jgi:hypothetical protein
MADPITGTGGFQDCFQQPTGPGVEGGDGLQAACLARYEAAADPGYLAAKETFFDPWRPNADPQKTVQLVTGIDKSKYLVVKTGDTMRGVKVSVAISTVAAITIAAGSSIAAIGFFYYSKEGKKYRKRVFGG